MAGVGHRAMRLAFVRLGEIDDLEKRLAWLSQFPSVWLVGIPACGIGSASNVIIGLCVVGAKVLQQRLCRLDV
jgi:hypothetical protein